MTEGQYFNVKSVAIVGAGAAGLTTLFELLHTRKDGSTSIAYNRGGELDESKLKNDDPAFEKIVLFEQNSRIGGIWAPSYDDSDVISQELFDTERYDDPWVLKPKTPVPSAIKNQDYSVDAPLVVLNGSSGPSWNKSGVYRDLFSNVPGRYLRNSFIPYRQNQNSDSVLYPLITNLEVTDALFSFTQRYDLAGFIRFDSEIVDIQKTDDGNQWKLTVKQTSPNGTARWYTEDFDSVIISTGHYSVPHLPKIKGLSAWNARFKSSVLHSKSFRGSKPFRNKNTLFVGTGLSGLDILQYTFPVANRVTVSRTLGKQEIYPWLTKAAMSDGIHVKPRIKELRPDEGRKVIFEDGSFIDSVDYIIFSTGYHWHYPFLNKKDTGISVLTASRKSTLDGSSMIDGLFLNTFAIRDPTLAFVGITLTPLKWPSFEITASAIAGVWTNRGRLPVQRDQIEYCRKRVEQTGQSLVYHYYPLDRFPDYVSQLAGYLPKGRNSANIYDMDHLDEVRASFAVAEGLFYQYKEGKIALSDDIVAIPRLRGKEVKL